MRSTKRTIALVVSGSLRGRAAGTIPSGDADDTFGSAASLVGSGTGAPPMPLWSAVACPSPSGTSSLTSPSIFTTTGNLMFWISR